MKGPLSRLTIVWRKWKGRVGDRETDRAFAYVCRPLGYCSYIITIAPIRLAVMRHANFGGWTVGTPV